jgi:hypothetical protein
LIEKYNERLTNNKNMNMELDIDEDTPEDIFY